MLSLILHRGVPRSHLPSRSHALRVSTAWRAVQCADAKATWLERMASGGRASHHDMRISSTGASTRDPYQLAANGQDARLHGVVLFLLGLIKRDLTPAFSSCVPWAARTETTRVRLLPLPRRAGVHINFPWGSNNDHVKSFNGTSASSPSGLPQW